MDKKVTDRRQEDLWFTAMGEEDGKPLIFRGRQSVPTGAVESEYPTLVTITWKYPIDDENGMPDAEVNHSQIELEDALEVLDSPRVSFQMLVVTGNGRKEWHWYVADLDMWMKRMNELISDNPVPIDIVNSYQPQWSLYHDFVSGLE